MLFYLPIKLKKMRASTTVETAGAYAGMREWWVWGNGGKGETGGKRGGRNWGRFKCEY